MFDNCSFYFGSVFYYKKWMFV